MTAAENRRRINALRAEEAGQGKSPTHHTGKYGPERRRRAQINKQRMGATA